MAKAWTTLAKLSMVFRNHVLNRVSRLFMTAPAQPVADCALCLCFLFSRLVGLVHLRCNRVKASCADPLAAAVPM